jgi:DNA invertase Pin-like site-specific DNA recombinase
MAAGQEQRADIEGPLGAEVDAFIEQRGPHLGRGHVDKPVAVQHVAEVMATIRELRDRDIVLRSLREGIDSSTAAGRMVAGLLASLAELELELGRERRAAAREARRARGQAIGRPRALDQSKAALARRMHASGEPVSTIAATLSVSRATVYRVLAEETDSSDTST